MPQANQRLKNANLRKVSYICLLLQIFNNNSFALTILVRANEFINFICAVWLLYYIGTVLDDELASFPVLVVDVDQTRQIVTEKAPT